LLCILLKFEVKGEHGLSISAIGDTRIMARVKSIQLPELTDAGLHAAEAVLAIDEFGQVRDGHIAAERALTIYLDKREIVTLMTLGTCPELLVLGWLRNQRLLPEVSHIKAIQVDWETESAAVTTYAGVEGLDEKLGRKTVTTGCGQGTVFGDLMDDLDKIALPQMQIRQSRIYGLLLTLQEHNKVYRRAGAVHGCALCHGTRMELFVEDVGRHNAVDAIAGHMWLDGINGHDKLFYTTGRLTSEMIIKVAQMGIPVLLSRSGATHMGLELARKVGVTLIARAKGQHFLVYNGAENIEFDAIPESRSTGGHENTKKHTGT
jgi:FdhD protein